MLFTTMTRSSTVRELNDEEPTLRPSDSYNFNYWEGPPGSDESQSA